MKKYTYGILVTALFGLVISTTVSALSYSQDIGVSFTFNPTLKVTLSSADIHIDNLAPGTVNDSNIVNVNILSNVSNGYTLTATVGNDSLYDTKDLLHTSSTITSKFSSIDFSSSLASNTELSDNTWGYSYLDESLNNGTNTTWTNYSGLPLYSDDTNIATLKTSTTPASSATGDNIKFKISARASLDQPSGEYRNVINFNIVATPVPKTLYMAYEDAGKEKHNGYFKMQDMSADICNSAEVLDEASQMQVIDTRDDKIYWITKLRDGKCWMTQNLDHDIDENRTYTPQDTDIPANWTPDRSTYQTGDTTWADYSIGTVSSPIQQSYDPGTKYWNSVLWPEDQSACESYGGSWEVYCENADMSSLTGNPHYHLGNYYNWGAAVAMNDTSAYTTYGQYANQSICPAGWTLPKADSDGTSEPGYFRYMVEQYGWDDSYRTMKTPHIWESPLYFPLSGGWHDSSGLIGSGGLWWSSVVPYIMNDFYDSYVFPSGSFSDIRNGLSVRCVSR